MLTTKMCCFVVVVVYCYFVVGTLWLLYCCFVVVCRCFFIRVIVVSLSFHHCFSIFFVFCVTLFSCVVLLLVVCLCCCWLLFKYSPKGCKTQFVTAGRLVTVLDMRPSTTNTITTNLATKFTAHCKLTLLWILHESELPRHMGKRAQTLTAPTTQTRPDDQCHNYRRVAQ